MRAGHPLVALAEALASACHVDFEPYTYEDRDWSSKDRGARVTKTRRPTVHDVEVVGLFCQQWGSTALGFGGIGGQAITPAYTTVLQNNLDGEFAVYFNGRFAYKVRRPNQAFARDLANRGMAHRNDACKYESKE